jgi:hypothetical protein
VTPSAIHEEVSMAVRRGSLRPALVVLGALIALALPTFAHAQSDSQLGTWTLNLAKSNYNPGPPPKSEERIYEPFGKNGVSARFERVDAEGHKIAISYSANYDGKDYKYLGSLDADTIVLKRVDGYTVDATLKKNGIVVQTSSAVVSKDGKTRTLTTSGKNGKGELFHNVVVFDRK